MPFYLMISIALLAITSLVFGVLWYRLRRFKSMNCQIAELVFSNIDAYALLIDEDFNVIKSNYYIRNKLSEQNNVLKVGNLLRCANSIKVGCCGEHKLCSDCGLRKQIATAFRENRNFTKYETPIKLVLSDETPESVVECCISVTGSHIVSRYGDQLLLTIHDITHIKNTQLELNNAMIRVKEADRIKSILLANINHELRTPLNAIIGFSELLADTSTEEERRGYIQILHANNELLLKLVDNIIDLSKIEAGMLEFSYNETDINGVMSELEDIYRCRHIDDPVEIIFEKRYPSYYAELERNHFSQVMSNFLSNAAKFTAEGEIRFGFEKRDKEIYCYVSDTGIGISEEKQKEVFDRFFKAESHKQGAGIGLAICKSMIDSEGGKIGVESQLGVGSTFWFTLPVPPIKQHYSAAVRDNLTT